MRALSLFSGIGGIDLAAEWAGIETVAFCEQNQFCQKVLKKHWPSVPIYDDVRKLTKERLDADGVGPIDIVFSGDPCQPYSSPGSRKGSDDDRFLWPEVNRIVDALNPRWIVRENVAGNITLGLDGVLADLEDRLYATATFVIPALAVGAEHERERVFVVANAHGEPGLQTHTTIGSIRKEWNTWQDACRSSWRSVPRIDWGVSGPPVSRVPNGVSRELDKSRAVALGNAVVPQHIYPILNAVKMIDEMMQNGRQAIESTAKAQAVEGSGQGEDNHER